MGSIIFYLVHSITKIHRNIKKSFYSHYLVEYCRFKGVDFIKSKIQFDGLSILNFKKNSNIKFGKGFRCISSKYRGMDNSSFSKIYVYENGNLTIGHHFGMTNSTINCHSSITIGNYVNIGAGCIIMDSDFHSLDWHDRLDGTDIQKRKDAPIIIKDLAFIGAHSIILKGVTIGEKSIIGAGSVVACNIPDGEIWAGNPARFIKKNNY